MKLNVKALSLAAMLGFAMLWVICSLFVWVTPSLAMEITAQMMHMESAELSWSLGWVSFFVGLVAWSGIAGASALLISVLYNRFLS